MTKKQKGINAITSHLATCEGKKHQASIGDIREIVKQLASMMSADLNVTLTVLAYGRDTNREKAAVATKEFDKMLAKAKKTLVTLAKRELKRKATTVNTGTRAIQ